MLEKKEFIETNRIDLERRMLPSLAFVAMVMSFIGFFVNLLIDLDIQVFIVTASTFIAYGICYFLARNEKYRLAAKWGLWISSLFVFNAYWYYNYGSRGPALYIFVIIYSFGIFIFDRKEAIVLTVTVIANLLILFILELRNPDIVGHYATNEDRVIDAYSTLVYYGLIFYVFLSLAREAYFVEYKNAKRADQLKSSFLANMSHEIRTPLNAIVGFSNILAEEELSSEERKQYASIINTSNESLLRLVNDILDVSMIESDQLNLEVKSCDVGKILSNLEDTFKYKVRNQEGKSVINEIKGVDIMLETDSSRLQQVLVNLLDNAVKYTESGIISFGVETEDTDLIFYVKDNGIGIHEKHQKYLFERFFKVEDDKTKLFRGTGIGLYLTKKMVNLMGGEIWVESEFGQGSTFYFSIPKTGLKINKRKEVDESYVEPEVSVSEGTTVLVIEDQESNQEYYKAILRDYPIRLIQAMNGKEGLTMLDENNDIQLVLLDIKMPDMDGFEVLEKIRENNKTIPVIAQTAYAMASDKEKTLSEGFTDYLSKPIDKLKLLNIISKYTQVNFKDNG